MSTHRQLLVVSHDVSERQDIGAFLETAGFHTQLLSSGAAAIDWMQSHHPIAVLIDLNVGEIDGVAVVEYVEQNSPEIPVIVMSNSSEVSDVIDVVRKGAADFLQKPITDMLEIVDALHRAMERVELVLQNKVYRQELEQANRELREYVRVLERDQKAGRRVQSKLLPEAPADFGDFHIDYRMVPSLYLSGDFVDFGLINKRFLAFYLTDVSGHGAASAFVTVWLKQLVRRYFRESDIFRNEDSFDKDAGTLVGLINKELMNSGVGCHMTSFVGVIDTHTRQMRYVFGGHLPFPILITEAGAEYLSGKGKPLGIFADAEWDVHSLELPDKFSLVVFSDGILEILPDQDLIDKENTLLNVLKDNGKSVESVCKAFGLDVLETVPDDIAILMIESEKLQ
ncbi:MAG: SpoIIE family protein phosphatase [Agarilytica sp.]